MERLSILHAILLSLWQLVASQTSTSPPFPCSAFTLTNGSYIRDGEQENARILYGISAGVVCNSTTCPLDGYGILSMTSQSNLKLASDAAMFNLIGRTVNHTFPRFVTGDVGNRTGMLRRGQSGWLVFVQRYTCYTGVVTGCNGSTPTGGSPFENQRVDACSPNVLRTNGAYGVPLLDGAARELTTTEEQARNRTTNPADPAARQNQSSTSAGAVNSYGSTLLSLLAMLLVFLTL